MPRPVSRDCFSCDTEAEDFQDIRGDLTEEESADMYL